MYLPRKDANFNTGTNNVINPKTLTTKDIDRIVVSVGYRKLIHLINSAEAINTSPKAIVNVSIFLTFRYEISVSIIPYSKKYIAIAFNATTGTAAASAKTGTADVFPKPLTFIIYEKAKKKYPAASREEAPIITTDTHKAVGDCKFKFVNPIIPESIKPPPNSKNAIVRRNIVGLSTFLYP